jgi:hypothetical protein
MTAAPAQLDTRVRSIGAGASIAAGGIYLLIGLGVLSVGSTRTGEAVDLLAFGVVMASVSIVVGVLLAMAHSQAFWIAIAAAEALLIVGYLAVASVREPPVELWGLTIKALQAVVLAAAVVLAVRERRTTARS